MGASRRQTFKEFIKERDDTVGKDVQRSYNKILDKKYMGKERSKMTTRTKGNVMYGGGGFMAGSGADGGAGSGGE